MSSIFLSHSSVDKPFVRDLAQKLTQKGIKVWLDEAELKIGDSLIVKLSDAIENNDFVAAVLSKDSVKSNWVKKELSIAMTKEVKGKKVVVLPILLDDCDIPDFLIDKIYADFRTKANYEIEFNKLVTAAGGVVEPEVKVEKTVNIKSLREHAWEPIEIIGIKKQMTSRIAPNKDIYKIYFELSQYTDHLWQGIFHNEWKLLFYSMKREVTVYDNYLVLISPLEEIEKYHLSELKRVLLRTNEEYSKYLEESERKRLEKLENEKKEKDKIESILDKIVL